MLAQLTVCIANRAIIESTLLLAIVGDRLSLHTGALRSLPEVSPTMRL
ncbi:hypothetical protein [Anabaena azotica]|uniref:Uncharacterized protein n=1 Tax=Anabaena azotica FACHB-119 TaxID=947527 RepID=A0ABR8CZW1_9NOST|nr:hypothetical protein [Anabaena azotica]MBD2500484.1 hypothetical protein [Anabaena azotica FACHB-119]